jgi:hypothetical protein
MRYELAHRLLAYRNLYGYPYACIRLQKATPAIKDDARIGHGMQSRFVSGPQGSVTNVRLDRYHRRMLRSTSQGHRHAACASIVYWGFFRFSDNYARKMVEWFVNKHPTAKEHAATPALVYAVLTKVSQAAGQGDWGAALGCLGQLGMLRRLSFGSKVIAFMDPQNAGVYDNRINDLLRNSPCLERAIFGPLGSVLRGAKGMAGDKVASRINQIRYQVWCRRLQRARDALMALGPRLWWKASEAAPRPWRALDVERALFAWATDSADCVSSCNEMGLLEEFFGERAPVYDGNAPRRHSASTPPGGR